MEQGERQVADTLDGIRYDHLARYEFAAERLAGKRVVDAGCGIGYGSWVMAEAGCSVLAVDKDEEAIAFAREHYAHDLVEHVQEDLQKFQRVPYDAAVCFEAVEHLPNPGIFLKKLAGVVEHLIVSAPNEDVFPLGAGVKFHHQHYTPEQLEQLLNDAGFEVREWFGQEGLCSQEVEPKVNGRTLIAVAVRSDSPKGGTHKTLGPLPPPPPKRIAIVAQGVSKRSYVEKAIMSGGRFEEWDEVWAINSMGGIIQHDRLFHMDNVLLQERRAAVNPEVRGMLKWLRHHPGPVYTSTAFEDWPGLVEFPLEEVLNTLGVPYLNNTVAYAVAYALFIGVKSIHMFGADYTYPDAHIRESGRACTEFLLGFAAARGVRICVPRDTTLLDATEPMEKQFYGYDGWDLELRRYPTAVKIVKTPKELPSVTEIEERYRKIPKEHGRDASIHEIKVQELGGGWYQLPDGRKVQGKAEVERLLGVINES